MRNNKIGFAVFVLIGVVVFTGCSNNTEEAVIDCSLSDLTVSIVDSTSPDCLNAGGITLQGEGGTAPYRFSLDGLNYQNDGTFMNLSAGDFEVFVEDADGCIRSSTITLEAGNNGIAINVVITESQCLDNTGTIEVEAAGGDGIFTYSIDNGPNQTESTFSNLGVGSYVVKVIDGEGCESLREVQVKANTSLSNTIMPIIMNDCAIAGCHNGTQSPNLTTRQAVISNAARIKSETQARTMPRNRTLSQNEIDLIACWVDSGALDN